MSIPDHVGVYGGGRMGAGIAHAFLQSGATVTIVESDERTAAAARGRVESSLAKAAERGSLAGPVGDVLARLTLATDAAVLEGCALVVEAVPEDVPLKQEVLTRIEQVAPGASLATNTSSLSVDALASDLRK